MRNLQELCLRCETVKKQFDGLDTIDIMSMLCTMIDHVAFITGMSTEELMKLISPVITEGEGSSLNAKNANTGY